MTYTDWWHPLTTSVLQVGALGRRTQAQDGFRAGLLETLDERTELCRRVWQLDEVDRLLLFLWYVQELPIWDIAKAVGISRRQCFRRRAKAIRALVDPDPPDQVA